VQVKQIGTLWRNCVQGGQKKRTPEKQYGRPLFWTTL